MSTFKPDLKIVVVVKDDNVHYQMENGNPIKMQVVALALFKLEQIKKDLVGIDFQPDYEVEEFDN